MASYVYDVWGTLISYNGTLAEKNDYLYTGREYDWETGIYYYRARSYDSELGRFLQQDPEGMVDGPNMYVYVGNDPGNGVDPSGLVTFQWLRYKQWYWWWGWHYHWVNYGFKVKFTAFETGLIAAGVSVVAIIAGVVPGGQPTSIVLGISAVIIGLCSTYGLGFVIYAFLFPLAVYYWCQA